MNTDNRQLFTDYPLVRSDQSLVNDGFYKFLNDARLPNTYRPRSNFFEAIDAYLGLYGFDIKKHKLDSESLKTLEYVFDAYQRMFTPVSNPVSLYTLLRPTADNGYYLAGVDSDQRFKPTAISRHILKQIGLVYDLDPKHYYFEIVNGYLFIKYQSILGSRRIAKLKDLATTRGGNDE